VHQRPIVGADGEDKARPESMRRAHEIAEIDGLGDAFDTDGEVAARQEAGFSPLLSAIASGAAKAGRATMQKVADPAVSRPVLGILGIKA
jgi:hypothetical protein